MSAPAETGDAPRRPVGTYGLSRVTALWGEREAEYAAQIAVEARQIPEGDVGPEATALRRLAASRRCQRVDQSRLNPGIRDHTLENFRGLDRLCRVVGQDLRDWPLRRVRDPEPGGPRWEKHPAGCLTLFGPWGTGKTHLATALLKSGMAAGLDGGWAKEARLVERLRDLADIDSAAYREHRDHALAAEVLVLDDVTPGDWTAFARRTIKLLVDARTEDGLHTVITTNTPPETWQREEPMLHSRLFGRAALVVALGGGDRREPVTAARELAGRYGQS